MLTIHRRRLQLPSSPHTWKSAVLSVSSAGSVLTAAVESRAQNEPTVQAAVRLPGRQSALHASLRLLHDKFQLAFACGSLDQTARSGVLPDMKAV